MNETTTDRTPGTGVPARIDRIDINRIMQGLPHRYPFLLVDRVVDFVADESAVGIKNVTFNEPFFQGHFPGNYVMPGVLIVEAMCQTAGVVVCETMGPEEGYGISVFFMSIENAKFRRPVVPGDQLKLHVVKERRRGNVWRFSCEAKVDGVKVADATYTAMVIPKDKSLPKPQGPNDRTTPAS
jgi:3-hydroxyacyl-[acyl-carrier-protein] dehydratase